MRLAGAGIAGAVLLAALGGTAGVVGDEPDPGTRRALVELKELCDAGLVAPAVCVEKQRAILGLPPGAAVPSAPPADVTTPVPAEGMSLAPMRYTSPLGFEVDLPPGWVALSPDEVRAGFETLREQVAPEGATARVLDRLETQALAGTTDFFAHGREQVQIQRAPVAPPPDAVAIARFCDRLEENASRAAGRPLRTHACGMRLVAGVPALYVERDAVLPGSRTAQYWLPSRAGGAVLFVLTAAEGRSGAARRDLDAIVTSIRWP